MGLINEAKPVVRGEHRNGKIYNESLPSKHPGVSYPLPLNPVFVIADKRTEKRSKGRSGVRG